MNIPECWLLNYNFRKLRPSVFSPPPWGKQINNIFVRCRYAIYLFFSPTESLVRVLIQFSFTELLKNVLIHFKVEKHLFPSAVNIRTVTTSSNHLQKQPKVQAAAHWRLCELKVCAMHSPCIPLSAPVCISLIAYVIQERLGALYINFFFTLLQ